MHLCIHGPAFFLGSEFHCNFRVGLNTWDRGSPWLSIEVIHANRGALEICISLASDTASSRSLKSVAQALASWKGTSCCAWNGCCSWGTIWSEFIKMVGGEAQDCTICNTKVLHNEFPQLSWGWNSTCMLSRSLMIMAWVTLRVKLCLHNFVKYFGTVKYKVVSQVSEVCNQVDLWWFEFP